MPPLLPIKERVDEKKLPHDHPLFPFYAEARFWHAQQKKRKREEKRNDNERDEEPQSQVMEW